MPRPGRAGPCDGEYLAQGPRAAGRPGLCRVPVLPAGGRGAGPGYGAVLPAAAMGPGAARARLYADEPAHAWRSQAAVGAGCFPGGALPRALPGGNPGDPPGLPCGAGEFRPRGPVHVRFRAVLPQRPFRGAQRQPGLLCPALPAALCGAGRHRPRPLFEGPLLCPGSGTVERGGGVLRQD